jgi:hypothetical protein
VRNLATLGVPPPADPHDRVQARRFLRALLLRCFVVTLPLWVLLALVGDLPSWWFVVGGALMLALALEVLWLSHRVRRDEQRATPD